MKKILFVLIAVFLLGNFTQIASASSDVIAITIGETDCDGVNANGVPMYQWGFTGTGMIVSTNRTAANLSSSYIDVFIRIESLSIELEDAVFYIRTFERTNRKGVSFNIIEGELPAYIQRTINLDGEKANITLRINPMHLIADIRGESVFSNQIASHISETIVFGFTHKTDLKSIMLGVKITGTPSNVYPYSERYMQDMGSNQEFPTTTIAAIVSGLGGIIVIGTIYKVKSRKSKIDCSLPANKHLPQCKK